jgi:hypothetical protein
VKLTSTNRPFGLIIKLSQIVFGSGMEPQKNERDKRRSPSLSQYVRPRVEPVNCQPRFVRCKPSPDSEPFVPYPPCARNPELSVVSIAPPGAPISISVVLRSRWQKVCSRGRILQVLSTFDFRLSTLKSRLDFEGSFHLQLSTFDFYEFPGDHTARVTPVPIPNTVVKPRRADDTARATVWERRSSPGIKFNRPS